MNWVRRGRAAWHLIASRNAATTVIRCTGAEMATPGTEVSSRTPGPQRRCPACSLLRLEVDLPRRRATRSASALGRILNRIRYELRPYEEP